MQRNQAFRMALAGMCAGAVTGLFGAGGGLVLVPLLGLLTDLEERQVFPVSVSVILPVCLTTLSVTALRQGLPWEEATVYLIGSAGGGLLAGLLGKKIRAIWLHRALGIMILWGGFRWLTQ